jgi:hypothetical protein
LIQLVVLQCDFALSRIRRDGVAAHELAIIFGQHTAIIQCNAPIGMNFFHRDQFAIGEFATILGFVIGLELQSVASGHPRPRGPRIADSKNL